MTSSRAHAYPRLGILGNPSDGYGGRVLSLTFSDFKAEVEVTDAGPSVGELFRRLESGAAEGIETLTSAAARSYARAHPLPDSARLSFSTVTDIPRQAGLAGSSAVVTAALRALAGALGVHLSPRELALLAWEAETKELGIEAGPQDRVAQAHGGLLDMDFSKPWSEDSFRSVDPTLLPAMLVAWDSRPGSPSGDVHDEVRARHEARDPEVTQAMERFPQIAADGVLALAQGSGPSLRGTWSSCRSAVRSAARPSVLVQAARSSARPQTSRPWSSLRRRTLREGSTPSARPPQT